MYTATHTSTTQQFLYCKVVIFYSQTSKILKTQCYYKQLWSKKDYEDFKAKYKQEVYHLYIAGSIYIGEQKDDYTH